MNAPTTHGGRLGFLFQTCLVYLDSFAAPAGQETLKQGDLGEIVETILDAKDKAYELGLKLKLRPIDVKSICRTHQDPQDRLTAIIEYLLKQVEPRPTWRLIVDALRSHLVNLPRLAEEVVAKHFPHSHFTQGSYSNTKWYVCVAYHISSTVCNPPLPTDSCQTHGQFVWNCTA